jgi:dTDP-4-dehydrorhamnose 3,5-epimerase
MPFLKTHLPGLLIFEPKIIEDNRGYFYESYNENTFLQKDINIKFVQDNQAQSAYGVVRGLHFQLAPFAQTKLVRVLRGGIKDVAVDLRKGSPTYGQSFSIILTDKNKKQLLVPKGFAHGYAVLSESAEVFYKCDEFYNKQSEAGLLYCDPVLNINWQIPDGKKILSEKDKAYPMLNNCEHNFVFEEAVVSSINV